MNSKWHALLQDVELMPQYQDFGFQSPSRLEAIAQHANEKEANCNHATIMFRFAGDRESNGLGFGSDRRTHSAWIKKKVYQRRFKNRRITQL